MTLLLSRIERLTRVFFVYLRAALKKAGIVKPFRAFHDLRHTAITHDAAAGNPQAYVQMKAGHSQGAITERYIHGRRPVPRCRSEDRGAAFRGAGVESWV